MATDFDEVGLVRLVHVYKLGLLHRASLLRSGWHCPCGGELGFNPHVGQVCKCGARVEEVLRQTAREARG